MHIFMVDLFIKQTNIEILQLQWKEWKIEGKKKEQNSNNKIHCHVLWKKQP